MRVRHALAVLAVLLPSTAGLVVASSQVLESPLAGPVARRSSPAPPGSSEPNLALGPDGTVWMSWLETKPEGGRRFRIASRQGDGWTSPATIAEGSALLANWADFPSVHVSRDGTMAAHWLERDSPAGRGYGIRVRTSRDGLTWSDPVTPHAGARPAEFGFVSFFDDPASGLGVVWLDGRNVAGGTRGSMALWSAALGDGRPARQQPIDDRVCDCCQTSAASTDAGVVVAYRDRSDTEVRDISVTRLVDGRWTNPVTVHADGWQINACPVNGPAVAARGREVAVAWFTGAGGEPRTLLAFSSDGGASFGPPVNIASGATLGRVGLASIAPGRMLVSNLERGESGGQLVVREARHDGSTSAAVVVTAMETARASGFARMVIDGRGRMLVAWTDTTEGAPSQVRVADAPLR